MVKRYTAMILLMGVGIVSKCYSHDNPVVPDDVIRTSISQYLHRIPTDNPGEAGFALVDLPKGPTLRLMIEAYETSRTFIRSDFNRAHYYLYALSRHEGLNDPKGREILKENIDHVSMGPWIDEQINGRDPEKVTRLAEEFLGKAQQTSPTVSEISNFFLTAMTDSKKLAGRLPEVRSLIESADWNRAVMERGYRVLGDNEDFEYMAAQLAAARNYEERSIIYRCIELGSQGNQCRIVAQKETLLPVLMDAVRKETVPSAVQAGVLSMVCFLKEDTSLESFLVELEEKHGNEEIATMNRQIRHAWKTLGMQ